MSNTVLIFDTETTGIPDWMIPSEDASQPHIVQLAAVLVGVDTQRIIQSMDVIIRPDGWEIEPELTEIHGITKEYAMDVGIPERMALEMFLALWNGRPRIAFNTTFDNRIIRIGTKRYFDEATIEGWHAGKQGEEWRCMMLAARKIMGGKQPTLAEAHQHFIGSDHQDAHTAMGDTLACMRLFFAIQSMTEAA